MIFEPNVVVYVFNLSNWEAKADGGEIKTSLVYVMSSRWDYRETLSLKKKLNTGLSLAFNWMNFVGFFFLSLPPNAINVRFTILYANFTFLVLSLFVSAFD